MSMKIVVAGDSHSFGSELVPERFRVGTQPYYLNLIPREHHSEIRAYRESHSWPAVLKRIIGDPDCEIINLSEPGSGNHRISMRLIEWLSIEHDVDENSNLLVIVGWSSPERFDVWSDINQRWSTFYPSEPDLSTASSIYYKHMQSVKESYQRYFGQIIMLQRMLNDLGIKHAMFNSISDISFGKRFLGPFERFIDFEKIFDQSMLGLGISAGCKTGPGMHFLEDGHRLWAEKMADFLGMLYPNLGFFNRD